MARSVGKRRGLAGQLAQELPLIHVVLESLVAVDEDDGNLVVVLSAQFMVGIDINFLPCEAAAARELGETFLNHFTQMTPLARVHYDTPGFGHAEF